MKEVYYDFDFDATMQNVREKRAVLEKAFADFEDALVSVTAEVNAFYKMRSTDKSTGVPQIFIDCLKQKP